MGKQQHKRRQMRRIRTEKRKRWIESRRWIDEHHLGPRSRSGSGEVQNLIRIKRYRHEAWHALFDLPGNQCRTIDEIIALLVRLRDAKRRQKRKR